MHFCTFLLFMSTIFPLFVFLTVPHFSSLISAVSFFFLFIARYSICFFVFLIAVKFSAKFLFTILPSLRHLVRVSFYAYIFKVVFISIQSLLPQARAHQIQARKCCKFVCIYVCNRKAALSDDLRGLPLLGRSFCSIGVSFEHLNFQNVLENNPRTAKET